LSLYKHFIDELTKSAKYIDCSAFSGRE